MAMTKKSMAYEAPKAKVYRFDENDEILTASGSSGTGGGGSTTDPIPTPEYAARALNEFMGGTNTTIE